MTTIESYEINNKLYVTAKFLSAYFNKSTKQVSRWKQDGMPVAEKPEQLQIRADVFFLKDCVEWVSKNINPSKSRATQKRNNDFEVIDIEDEKDEIVIDINGKIKQANEMLQLKRTSHDDADRIKKVLDGLIQAVKLGEQTKELIPKKDTEKAVVEIISTMIAGYKRDINILPKELENRKEEEIKQILENTYKANVEKYKKLAKNTMLNENKIYDILEEAFSMIINNIPVSEILKRMKHEVD